MDCTDSSTSNNRIMKPLRVTYANPMFCSQQPTFEEWPVSETYRKNAEALITASVNLLDAQGKQGNVHEVRQFLNFIEQSNDDLSATAIQTIVDSRNYLEWFEKPRLSPLLRTLQLRAAQCGPDQSRGMTRSSMSTDSSTVA